MEIIPFLKRVPEFAIESRTGGQYNGYLLISKSLVSLIPDHIEGWLYGKIEDIPNPHGGITLYEPTDYEWFINKSETFWIPENHLEHPDYSKYVCVGFDTLHYGDTWEEWDYEAVKNHTLEWKSKVEEYFKNLKNV